MASYQLFKHKFRYDGYLSDIKDNQQRVAMTKFHTSAHHLEVELGRYTRPVTAKEQRVCKASKVQATSLIDDEFHCQIAGSHSLGIWRRIRSFYSS